MLQRNSVIILSSFLVMSSAWSLDLRDIVNQQLNKPTTESTSPVSSNNPDALANFSDKDQTSGLKQALTQGAEQAVKSLAKENGYLGNEKVKIPLPEGLHKAEKLMRQFGMGKYADDLTTSMNRAAETAVPEAKTLLVGAVKKMTVTDVKNILMGEPDAATQFFRKNTESGLSERFKPIVEKSMEKVKLAQNYNNFASKGVKYGLVAEQDANLSDYITRKALDGLFIMMAEQEKQIRENPLQATGALAKKIFSAIKL